MAESWNAFIQRMKKEKGENDMATRWLENFVGPVDESLTSKKRKATKNNKEPKTKSPKTSKTSLISSKRQKIDKKERKECWNIFFSHSRKEKCPVCNERDIYLDNSGFHAAHIIPYIFSSNLILQ